MANSLELFEMKDSESMPSLDMEPEDPGKVPPNSNNRETISKYRIFKNLAVVSIGNMIILGTDDVLLTFQSTLNSEEGMGVLTASLQCFLASMTSLLMPKYLIFKIGSKAVMLLSIILFVPFFAANYYPTWITMITSSFFVGVGFSLIWNSICTYLNDLSGLYDDYCTAKAVEEVSEIQTEDPQPETDIYRQLKKADTTHGDVTSKSPELKSENINCFDENCTEIKFILHSKNNMKFSGKVTSQLDSITSQFFGFHSLIYQTGYLWSSLMSYYILQTDSGPEVYNDTTNCSCGAEYCNTDTECSETNLKQPSDLTRNILISVCIALALASAVFILIFLEDFKPKETDVSFSMVLLLATLKQTRKKNLVLLIPLTIYTGLLKGFYVGDYTKSYIGCAWGIRYIGLVTACSAVTMIVSSTLSGWLVKHVGRFKIFIMGSIANAVLMAILLTWSPDQDQQYMFFISSGLYGALYGTFFTQLIAYYGVLFKEEEEAAFGAFNFWNQIGTTLSLAFSNYLCNFIKVYSLIVCSTLGIMGYIVVEKYYSSKNQEPTTAIEG